MKRSLLQLAIPLMFATEASAAPILIGITGGSITFPGAYVRSTNLGLTNFDVITATGSILGTTPGGSPAAWWMHSGLSPLTINPSLNIYTAGYDSGPGNTDLHLTVPIRSTFSIVPESAGL